MSRKKADPTVQKDFDRLPPVSTPEARENQLVALAYDAAEKEFRNGTASSQLICHFLKIGSERDRLERGILAEQKKLITAKTGAIQSGEELKKMFEEATAAMKRYQGVGDRED